MEISPAPRAYVDGAPCLRTGRLDSVPACKPLKTIYRPQACKVPRYDSGRASTLEMCAEPLPDWSPL